MELKLKVRIRERVKTSKSPPPERDFEVYGTMSIYDVVTTLLGDIQPVGCSQTDSQNFDNLVIMTELVYSLLQDIKRVSVNKTRHGGSMKEIGRYADDFIRNTLQDF